MQRRYDLLALLALASMIASACSDEGTPEPAAPLPVPTLDVPTYSRSRIDLGPNAVPARVRIGDANGDGRLDIVVCGARDDRGMLEVHLANGDGSFRALVLETAATPRDVRIADVDGDGRADLVTANGAAHSVSIFTGDGARFERRDIDFAQQAAALVLTDLDGDGALDLAVTGATGLVGVAFGEGNARFSPWTYFPLPAGTTDIQAGDLDEDGDSDLIVAGWQSGEIIVLRNEGARVLRAAEPAPTFGKGAFTVALGSFDDGGVPDLAVPLLDQGSVQILYGRGDGGFRRGPAMAVGSGARAVAVAHLNTDGRQDLVVTNAESGDLTLLYGSRGRGFFTVAPVPAGKRPVATEAADLDGDGLDDLVTVDAEGHEVLVLTSRGDRIATARVALRNPLAGGDRSAIRGAATYYRRAVAAFQAGNDPATLRWLGKIITQSERALERRRLTPESAPRDWQLMAASLVLASDVHRYRLGEPAVARDRELELARRAERAGDSSLTVLQLIAAAEIQRHDLGDAAAAINTYAQAAYLDAESANRSDVEALIRTLAAIELDRLFERQPGHVAQDRTLKIPDPRSPELARLLDAFLPHLSAYGQPARALATYRAFSYAHPRSIRGAAADYTAFRTALLLGAGYGDAHALRDALVERHPDSLFGLMATAQLAASDEARGRHDAAATEAARVEAMARRFHVELPPVAAAAQAEPAG